MTVSSTTDRSGPYNGNGVTVEFAYEFRILEDTHITVVQTSAAGVETVLTSTDYTVAGVGDSGGGSITLDIAPPTGETITIIRNAPFTQMVDLENQGAYFAETIEQALDLAAMRDQQLSERLDRAVQIPISADPAELDGLIEDIIRLADSADEIDTVAGISAAVTTVAGISEDVSEVSAIAPAVTIVAGIAADVTTVAGIASDVTTVAGIEAEIIAVPAQVTAAEAAATAADASADAAAISAASINLPALQSGDKGKQLFVNAAEAGYDLRSPVGGIDPRTYGVVGDGVTNDAANFQACVTAAAGRVIWIDGLNISIPTGSITVPTEGMTLRGRGEILYGGATNLFIGGTLSTSTFNATATAAQTVFANAFAGTGPHVEVFVNGVRAIKEGTNAYTFTLVAGTLTVTFFAGRTVGDAVQIKASYFPSTTGIDPWATVCIGSGVIIKTTQNNEGRALAIAWVEQSYPDRQWPRFQFEPGAQIMGVDGVTGFNVGIWLHGAQTAQIQGNIFGKNANNTVGSEAEGMKCAYGLLLTGAWTPSDLSLYGGSIGFYSTAVCVPYNSFEGIKCQAFTFLNVGFAVEWDAPSTDTGLLLAMDGCHANVFRGVIKASNLGSIFVTNNDFFQNPSSTITFFTFLDLTACNTGVISGNQFQSYVAGANATGTRLQSGTSWFRIHDNFYYAANNTGTYTGTVIYSAAGWNTVGPNTYINTGRAVTVLAGASQNGLLTEGDVFYNIGTGARYDDAGDNTWFEKKWYIAALGSNTSIANAVFVDIDFTTQKNSDALTLVGADLPSAPAWATRVEIEAALNFAGHATGVRWARVLRNTLEAPGLQATVPAAPAGQSAVHIRSTTTCTPGDTLQLQVYQSSGGALNLMAGSYIKVLYK